MADELKLIMSCTVHDAIECGDLQKLKTYNDLLPVTNRREENAMHTAVRSSNLQILDFLLQMYPQMIHGRNQHGETPLHYAVVNDNIHLVLRLVRIAPEVIDIADHEQLTALQYAIMTGRTDIVVAMLAHNPMSIHQKGPKEDTLLHLTVEWGGGTRLKHLLAFCAVSLFCVQNYEKQTPLNVAVRNNDLTSVELILPANRDAIDIANKFGIKPAIKAVRFKDCDLFEYLHKSMSPHH